jgi:hypothetical protein
MKGFGEVTHAIPCRQNLTRQVGPVALRVCGAKGDVQSRASLGSIDLIAGEHRVAPEFDAAGPAERVKRAERFGRQAIALPAHSNPAGRHVGAVGMSKVPASVQCPTDIGGEREEAAPLGRGAWKEVVLCCHGQVTVAGGAT